MLFWRKRVLLAILEKAPGRKASKIQLIKWLFLLKEEEKIDRVGNFYDFLPYKYGPFSFLLYNEINELERSGLLESTGRHFTLAKRNTLNITVNLSGNAKASIDRIMNNYSSWSQGRVLKYIYEKYPWYASRSNLREYQFNRPLSGRASTLYTLGYQGLSIDAFLALIIKTGIQNIIDVRYNGISRKYGFSKSTLQKRCSDVNLKYYELPELGIPSNIRHQHSDKKTLWNIYTQDIIANSPNSMKRVVDIIKQQASVLMCFEKNPYDCHRHVLAKEISKISNLPIVHYNYEERKWGKELKYL
jgi:uncharacterized protein (DUF488 family)